MKEMKEKICDARTGMEYILIGDYYLPALKVPRTRPVGRWGMLHKAWDLQRSHWTSGVRPIFVFCRGKIGSLLRLLRAPLNIPCPLRFQTGC